MSFTQRLDGQWECHPAPILEAQDGSKVVYVGNDPLQQPWRWVTVEAAPVVEASPEPGLAATLMYPNSAATAQKPIDFVKSPKKVMGALLYREPDHGHWYQSAWMWFFLGLTALCAIIWFGPMGASNLPSDGTDLGDFVHYFGWLFVGWMFLAGSVTGALQRAGYRRLAAAYAIALWALISIFWHSQMKNSVNNR